MSRVLRHMDSDTAVLTDDSDGEAGDSVSCGVELDNLLSGVAVLSSGVMVTEIKAIQPTRMTGRLSPQNEKT